MEEDKNNNLENIKNDEIILVVDRIENKYAICQNRKTGEMIDIEIEKLPKEIKEGTHLKQIGEEYIICSKEDDEKRIQEKMNRLFK